MSTQSPGCPTRSPAAARFALPARPRLSAACFAVAIFIAAAAGGFLWSDALIERNFNALLRVIVDTKEEGQGDPQKMTQLDRFQRIGTTLQRAAFLRSDLLPLYGSSELIRRVPARAGFFFRDRPDGFAVFPVGRPGTASLIFLQNIAALGDATKGKRMAISLSPSWFFARPPTEDQYAGNFSRLQALRSLLNPRLSFTYRQALAQRLLLHPRTLAAERLLHFLAERLANGHPLDRAAYSLAWPLAQLQQAIGAEQDHFELAFYIERHLNEGPQPSSTAPAPLDWDRLIAEASLQSSIPAHSASAAEPASGPSNRDEAFRQSVETGPEWDDLELLLRGLRELDVAALVLAMPLQARADEHHGVSAESLALFSAKLHAMAQRWGATAETFDEHRQDPAFLLDRGDHLSNRGWMYYNRALDEFYHATLGQASIDRGQPSRAVPSPD